MFRKRALEVVGRRVFYPAVALALVIALAGCDRTKHYALTPDAARIRLAGTTIPDIAFGKSAHSEPGEITADGVQWAIVPGLADDAVDVAPDSADKVMILYAKLTPAADGTALTVDLAPPPGADPAKLRAMFDQHPAMAKMFDTITMEQADSVLTARPFSFSAIRGSMALAVLSELPNIRHQLDEEAKASEDRDRDTIHRAYDEIK